MILLGECFHQGSHPLPVLAGVTQKDVAHRLPCAADLKELFIFFFLKLPVAFWLSGGLGGVDDSALMTKTYCGPLCKPKNVFLRRTNLLELPPGN